jgi:hypothetical protein
MSVKEFVYLIQNHADSHKTVAIDTPGGKRNLKIKIKA